LPIFFVSDKIKVKTGKFAYTVTLGNTAFCPLKHSIYKIYNFIQSYGRKTDHHHEELIEMSQHLRYKSEEERIKFVEENKEIFVDGIGDLFFGTCRLANQLGVDIEEAFNLVKKEILAKYNHLDPSF